MSRRCCCARDCIVYADNWSPCPAVPDSDHWDQVSGTWTISKPGEECSGQYLVGTGAGAMLICKHPTVAYPQYVYVTISDIAGSRPRLLLGVDYNPTTSAVSSYYYLEFDPDNSLLTWGSGSSDGLGGFTETVLRQISQDYQSDLHGWLSAGDGSEITFSGGWFGGCYLTGWVCTSRASGKYSGLMNGPDATAAAEFPGDSSYFALIHHDDTPNVQDCGYCDCQCGNYCVPRTLAYQFTLLGGDPCCLEPSGELPFDTDEQVSLCSWASGSLDTGCGYFVDLHLKRPTDQGRRPACDTWCLEDVGYPGMWGGACTPPDYCTCDPFYMRWDAVTVQYPDSDACVYMIEIYEP